MKSVSPTPPPGNAESGTCTDLLPLAGITPASPHPHGLRTRHGTLSALQSLSLELPSPAYILGAILFGLIGMAAYWRGKRAQQPRTRWWGVALMFYPYVVSATWLLYAVGVALCLGMWWDGQRG